MVAGHIFRTFLFVFVVITPMYSSTMEESQSLLTLKQAFGNPPSLDSWVSNTAPCDRQNRWAGIICFNDAITGLRLGHMGLSGLIDISILLNLSDLRSISLVDNNFSGPLPEFYKLGALKALYLSQNHFVGELPEDFFSNMNSIKKIWLDRNELTGKIPYSLLKLPRLIELHLENNKFSGKIPAIDAPNLKSFNVSYNSLEGNIPSELSRFNSSSFLGNPMLCGVQIDRKCLLSLNHSKTNDADSVIDEKKPMYRKIGVICIVIFIAICLTGAIVSTVLNPKGDGFDELEKGIPRGTMEMMAIRKQKTVNEDNTAELVMMNTMYGVFKLSDLMKSTAEVLGTGRLGSSYKAVMGDGAVIVVKRLRDISKVGKKEFAEEIEKLGKLRHPNLLTPLAYHYRNEEKLVINRYVAGGSLMHLLHGDRKSNRSTLNWSTRLKIIRGIGRGLTYLHEQSAASGLPHGDLKSSNVLLGPDFEPLLADYGFFPLVNPTQLSQVLFAYKSPEFVQYRHVSPKSDAYTFGIVILEILTGKYPSQYSSNGTGGTDLAQWIHSAISESKEIEFLDPDILSESHSSDSLDRMKRLVQIGASCTQSNSELRLDIHQATRRIEEIAQEDEGEQM